MNIYFPVELSTKSLGSTVNIPGTVFLYCESYQTCAKKSLLFDQFISEKIGQTDMILLS